MLSVMRRSSTNVLAPMARPDTKSTPTGNRRRANRGARITKQASTSNQSGPRGPSWRLCRRTTAPAIPAPMPARISASNQYWRAGCQRRFTLSLLFDREAGVKPVAAPRAGPGLEFSAVDRHALAHAHEPVAALVAAAVAGAVVAHGHVDTPVAVADDHLRVLGTGVLERIREALLNQAVRGEIDAGRKLNGRALDPQFNRKSRFTRVLDELVEVLEARLGGQGRRLLGVPQHADHPAHLCERLAPRLLDDEQSLAFPRLVRAEQAPGRRRLHGHHADAVPDDVVQLARDPRALVRDREMSTLLPLALGPGGALFRLVGLPELAADRESDRPEDAEGDAGEPEVSGPAQRIVVGDDGRDADADRQAGNGLRAVTEHAQQAEAGDRNQDRDEAVWHEPLVDERARGERDAHGDRSAEREAAACEQRQGDREDRQEVEPERTLRSVLVVLRDRRLGETDADGRQDETVEPVTAGKRPKATPHLLKVLQPREDRLVRENDSSSSARTTRLRSGPCAVKVSSWASSQRSSASRRS